MEQLVNKSEAEGKKRRFHIGIILIVVGLLGMLLSAVVGPAQTTETPQTTVSQSAS